MTRTTISCATCHAGTTTASGGAGHFDGNIDVTAGSYAANVTKHAAGSGYTSCSTAACHSAPARFTAPAATWGANLDCGGCHGYPGATNPTISGTHQAVAAGSCNSCHSNVNPGGTHLTSTFVNLQLHLNGQVEGGSCNSCHGYPPVQTLGLMGHLGNYTGAKVQNYSGGGGVHAVTGHLLASVKPSDGFGTVGAATRSCATCHAGAAHNEGFGAFSTHHVQVVIDTQYKFDKNRPIVYNGKRSGTGRTSGTCSNVSCHFVKTPLWSTEAYEQNK
jgi:predicted CxxxxCH...CXXCH cytochrome family protein